MYLPHLFATTLTLATLASAAVFPPDSRVQMIDPKGFKRVMRQNRTSVVAFVAPWCGHCQKMAPEYSKAAARLHPLVPLYAVDCDDQKNKRLCSDQGVQGFPTIKLYPRGNQAPSVPYEGPRTSKGFFNFASTNIPHRVKKLNKLPEILDWVNTKKTKPRALLFTRDKDTPLLWQTLANKYRDQMLFGVHTDKKGKMVASLGFEVDKDQKAVVVVYPEGETAGVVYQGHNKYEFLSTYFKSILDGSLDLKTPQTPEEGETPTEAEPKPGADDYTTCNTPPAATEEASESAASATPAGTPEPDTKAAEKDEAPAEPEPVEIVHSESAGADGSSSTPAPDDDAATAGTEEEDAAAETLGVPVAGGGEQEQVVLSGSGSGDEGAKRLPKDEL